MNRLLLVEGEPPRIIANDFEPPYWPELWPGGWPIADVETREKHTSWLLERRAHGDEQERTLWELIRDSVRALARGGASGDGSESAIFRADLFVRWDAIEDGQIVPGRGQVWLNEVEHGFNGGCTLGWFGAQCMELALKTWVLSCDEAQRLKWEEGCAK